MTLKQSSWVSNQGPPAVLPSNSFQIDEVSALSLFWKGVNLVDSAKRVRLLPSAVLLKGQLEISRRLPTKLTAILVPTEELKDGPDEDEKAVVKEADLR